MYNCVSVPEQGTKSLFRYALLLFVNHYHYSFVTIRFLESTRKDVTSNDLVSYI
jgi:hypothetical protein